MRFTGTRDINQRPSTAMSMNFHLNRFNCNRKYLSNNDKYIFEENTALFDEYAVQRE